MSEEPTIWKALWDDKATRYGIMIGLFLPGIGMVPIAIAILVEVLSGAK